MRLAGTIALVAAMLTATPVLASPPSAVEPGYGVRFNQQDLDALAGTPDFEIADEFAVFRHVFAALPTRAVVYPTENYYYFTFLWRGAEFSGNLRLDAADRDDGVLHFAYFLAGRPWVRESFTRYRAFDANDGVSVSRLGPLEYRVTFEDRTVAFVLNDLADVEPPEAALRPGERYIGPVFDESGVRFFLLFSEPRAAFLFVLDESGTSSDLLAPVHPDHEALMLGQRTGFAYFADRFAARLILVGVNRSNVEANNEYDGPFDQLPDNFIEGEALRDAILARHPDLEGRIDRYGGYIGRQGRYLVAPYLLYDGHAELEELLRCLDPALDETRFHDCLMPDGDGG